MTRGRTFPGRLRWFETGTLVVFVGLAVRLADIQILQHDARTQQGVIQWLDPVPVPAERGNLLDRHGRSLALSVTTWSVGVATTLLDHKDSGTPTQVATRLAGILDLEPVETLQRLRDAKPRHTVLNRRAVLHRDSLEVLRRMVAVTLEQRHDRVYPRGGVGSSLIGHYRDTADGPVVNGLEQSLDELLRGEPGEAWRHKSPQRGPGEGFEIVTPARDGLDVVLTLDADLQAIAEDCLAASIVECAAIGGSVLVLDPATGEILAAADGPVIRNRDESSGYERFWDNYNFTGAYEPGSVFKIFTTASLLARSAVDTSLAIDCDDGRFDGYRIRNSEGHDFGLMAFRDAFIHSSNVYFARMILNLRREEFYRDLRLFGFGKPTGVSYPGPAVGIFAEPNRWDGRTQSTVSFGQAISASPLQVALAGATAANGGTLMAPMLVREVVGKDGRLRERREPVSRHRVMSEDLSDEIRTVMADVVTRGTGAAAGVDWTTVAGKTGTAQKVREGERGYAPGCYIASFLGLVPADEPRLLILTILDEPDFAHHYASLSAAPLFARVVEEIGRGTTWLSGVATPAVREHDDES